MNTNEVEHKFYYQMNDPTGSRPMRDINSEKNEFFNTQNALELEIVLETEVRDGYIDITTQDAIVNKYNSPILWNKFQGSLGWEVDDTSAPLSAYDGLVFKVAPDLYMKQAYVDGKNRLYLSRNFDMSGAYNALPFSGDLAALFNTAYYRTFRYDETTNTTELFFINNKDVYIYKIDNSYTSTLDILNNMTRVKHTYSGFPTNYNSLCVSKDYIYYYSASDSYLDRVARVPRNDFGNDASLVLVDLKTVGAVDTDSFIVTHNDFMVSEGKLINLADNSFYTINTSGYDDFVYFTKDGFDFVCVNGKTVKADSSFNVTPIDEVDGYFPRNEADGDYVCGTTKENLNTYIYIMVYQLQ